MQSNIWTARLCLMVFVTSVGLGCSKKDTSDEETNSVMTKVSVRAALVTVGTVPERLVVTGRTEALAKEKLVSPIAGKLISLTGIEGTMVKAGEVLAVIQSKEAQASEEGARVMLGEAKTASQKAEAERMMELAKAGQNGVAVRSRIGGLIATRTANPGEFVSENQELLSIIGPADIDFVADVPLFRMSAIRIGESARITLPTVGAGIAPLQARIIAIKPQADSSGQTAKVVFHFEGLTPTTITFLRTGIVGTAEITFDLRSHAMLVPKSAVVRNDETNEHIVMTFGSDSIAHVVSVTTGPEVDSLVSIESSILKPGMNVITEGNYSLADSTRITLIHQ
ncbi:MAG: HlyD family efflux transporter periplasmic adaptor subunit [Bacteroidota bacterium]|nr:HlyD family efflux transporter periplasmic adaptor subunit [Bacteroidota bacterium]MDP4233896.1 HlyD family efflux transporter periplasmic adaptor subunit [Bacteroidota bacterium]MDP4243568.1 HlyD family efflux transporter periplasmic adaptor subunit [Bacteroidota bacterium]MDP4289244.1 HlyD family efflux transporter periplasmic adaptor subunit [Bacteroidota bacterium]